MMLNNIFEKMEKELITGEEFRNTLEFYLNNEFQDTVKVQYILKDKDGTEFLYGLCGKDKEKISKEYELEGGYRVRVNVWQENGELDVDECEKLFECYWNKEYCDSTCGLPATDRENFIRKCDNTIKEWQKAGDSIAVVMMDLDNFKEVNSEYGHSTGSEVIAEFSRVIFREVDGKGVLIHQSGDEFDLLLKFNNYTEITELLYVIYKAVREHSFSNIKKINLSMAIGVWIIDSEKQLDFYVLRGKAEDTYHPKERNGAKQRNSIRINKNNNFSSYGDNMLKVGMLRILGNIYNSQVFHNIYLDYITSFVSVISLGKNIQLEIAEYLNWINPQYSNQLRGTIYDEKWDTKVDIAFIDIGLATLHGMLRNKNFDENKIVFHVKTGELRISLDNEEILYFDHESIQGELHWEREMHCKIKQNVETRKTVLVQAGYTTKLKVPEDIFYKIVRVDARPYLGGGLPDFWAATLSALINSVNDNPNFDDIVIYGDVQNIKNVMDFLNTISEWDDEKIRYISKKTYKPEGDVLKFKERCGGNVQTYLDEEELINHLYDIHKDINKCKQIEKISSNEKKRFMVRVFPYDELQLEITDGCRTDTIAHAFPIALEILRNKLDTKNEITDQAGRRLLELTDFKILLETPRNEKIPEYYFYDVDMLNNYYENIFINKSGLFRKRLDKNNQLDEMIKHVTLAISGEKKYATRRAILVVQNEIQSQGGYSPLGLVAIWLAPRFIERKIVIDYSYTWRTVEAIVGLPLSMYASVKFAENITKEIANQMTDKSVNVEIGHVSYIAHSLHMFTDEESMNIVRGIINEVSV